MASENTPHHHSSLHGADSLSYSENGIGQSRSNPSGLHTYEQRVEASGLGGDRYRAGPQAAHPKQAAAHDSIARPGADGSRSANPDGTYRTHGDTARREGEGGAISAGPDPEAKRPPRVHRSTSASSASSSASSNDGAAAATGSKGDSKTGKLMEKVGRSVHSAKLAEKGEAKREKAAGLK